jgi:hypothetical protein
MRWQSIACQLSHPAPTRPSPPLPPQVKDRHLVAQRMRAHVHAADATQLLIFPEGT